MKRLPRLLFAGLAVLALATGWAASAVSNASAADGKDCSVSTDIDKRPDLSLGDRGTCVTVAQGLLTNVGTYNGTFITEFDVTTENAVRQAQRNANLYASGIINQETWDMLARSSPATPQSATRNCDNHHYRTICVVKGNNGSAGVLYAIENGRVVKSFNVRTSDSRNPNTDPYKVTSEGRLKVTNKAAGFDYPMYYDDYTNTTNNSNGQQAIRYSAIFEQCGYDGNLRDTQCIIDYRGAANGGVDLNNHGDAKWLYDWSNTGTEIVILHSPNATL